MITDTNGDLMIAGYASLFDRVDLAGDVVRPGAFAVSLAARGPGGLAMLFQHDPSQTVGVWDDAREDARGLYVRGRITPRGARARVAARLVRAGVLDGLSIGFRTRRSRRGPVATFGRVVRELERVELWEVSLVTFPMLPQARLRVVPAPRVALIA